MVSEHLLITGTTFDQMAQEKGRKKLVTMEATKQVKRSSPEREQAMVAETTREEHDGEKKTHVFIARQENSSEENSWLIDSGCTNHMTPNEKLFIKINTDFKVPIRVGNGAVLMTGGKGDIEVMTKKGKRIIRDVFLVPKLGKNLLSVPQMLTHGYKVTFKNKACIIHDNAGRKIGEVKMINKSFHLKWPTNEETSMVAKDETAELWHKRL
ncbi:Retrovirus-related Pol polyprotein from transposon TNT 1-94 [Cardamine amara subsp. amara]|uniref:Retrovirus-related Pol polyprotein from transposon TNT 1-94 n=1 Tax=Cardamine amara subsp. amara TaxID=228776 RepID=A0ABD1BH09_CARAN